MRRKTLPILLSSLLILFSCSSEHQNPDNKTLEEQITTEGKYQNPIFPGDYPDPSILRDGEDYYMVHSSFEYYPGLLIWHSRDLINWTPLTTALNTYVGSVWAPELVKHHNKFYIYFPASNTNYVVWADHIEGPWSEPIELEVSMIDPGHVVDEEGNRYLYFSSGSYVPLTPDGLAIAGEVKHSYDGWEIPNDWRIECFCMEGPKLFKKGEYYYLTVAEGGTAGPPTGHMVISARSKSPLGPWENSPYNPILRTQSREEQWWSVGHGTVFDDVEGNWWMIFHSYEKDYYNMGRQTMLVPVIWTADGWYKLPEDISIHEQITLPNGATKQTHFSLSDDFEGEKLKKHWRFFKEYDTTRFRLEKGSLVIKGRQEALANSSPLLTMPQNHAYMAEVSMEMVGGAVGGLVLYYNEQAYSGILADSANVLTNLRGWQFVTEKEVLKRRVHLKLVNDHHQVDMFYSLDGENWHKVETTLEASGYHHNALNGFMSLRIGLVAMGDGEVKFKDFKYEELE